MNLLTVIVKLLKDLFPTVAIFIAGRKSKELEDVKRDNKTLESWQNIDNKVIDKTKVYNEEDW